MRFSAQRSERLRAVSGARQGAGSGAAPALSTQPAGGGVWGGGLSSGSPGPRTALGAPWRAPSTHLHPSSLPSAPARPPTSRAARPRPRAETGCTGLSFAMQTPTQAQVSRDKSTITYCPSSPPNISTRLWRSREGLPSSAQPPPAPAAGQPTGGTDPPSQARDAGRLQSRGWDAGRALRAEAGGGGRGQSLAGFPIDFLIYFLIYFPPPHSCFLPWLCPAGLVQAGGGRAQPWRGQPPRTSPLDPTLPAASHPPHPSHPTPGSSLT